MFGIKQNWWLHDIVNAPNATELFILKWLIFYYVNFTQLKKTSYNRVEDSERKGSMFIRKINPPAIRKHTSFSVFFRDKLCHSHTQRHMKSSFMTQRRFGPEIKLVNNDYSSGAWQLAFNIFLPFEAQKTIQILSSIFRLVITLTKISLWRVFCPMYWLKCVQLLLILYYSTGWLIKWHNYRIH